MSNISQLIPGVSGTSFYLISFIHWPTNSNSIKSNTQSAAEVGNKIRQLENRVSPVVWQPPHGDIIKINTDAAVPQNQNTISLEVVIRNSESKVLGAAQINRTFNSRGQFFQLRS
ncbi:hypothetical protein SLA2020_099980 [Shorea laevis]